MQNIVKLDSMNVDFVGNESEKYKPKNIKNNKDQLNLLMFLVFLKFCPNNYNLTSQEKSNYDDRNAEQATYGYSRMYNKYKQTGETSKINFESVRAGKKQNIWGSNELNEYMKGTIG